MWWVLRSKLGVRIKTGRDITNVETSGSTARELITYAFR
jgi:hypothetical protein